LEDFAVTEDSPEVAVETESRAGHGEIAALAYSLWEQRGCPEGCPEVDWYQAEQELASGNGSH
jgi:hypothetical protein